jgi:hypothetical protein
MSHFSQLPEFEKEFSGLSRKYKSLPDDIRRLEELISNPDIGPVGVGKNFATLHQGDTIKIVKTRLACKSLRERSMRIVYAYHEDRIEFMYIEIYYKGDKENEDRARIQKYIAENT